MHPTDDGDLDRRLEDAAGSDLLSVERVVTRALAAPPARRVSGIRLAASVAAAGVLVALAVLNWPARSRPPDPIRMRNVGEVIVVDYPDGSRAIIGPERTDSTLFAGLDYVMFLGESQ